MGLNQLLNRIGNEIIDCKSKCEGIKNEPKEGIYPRCFSPEVKNEKVGCFHYIVVGIDPGTATDLEQVFVKSIKNHKSKFGFKDIKIVANPIIQNVPYYTRVRTFLRKYSNMDDLNILWTELVKYQNQIGMDKKKLPLDPTTEATCFKKFLKRKIEIFAKDKRKPVLVLLGNEVFFFIKKYIKEYGIKVKGEIAEGKWFERLPGEEKTFKEMMEKFESEYFSNLASHRACKSYLKGLTTFFGDYILSEITPSLISQFRIKRKAEAVKPATIRRQLDIMKRAFNLAIREWEWVDRNPVTRISLERLNNRRDRWLAFDEEERLLRSCPPWLKEVVLFALNTGMRLGEILSLTWKGVDLFRRTVTVFKSKNNGRRTIPLNETALELLKATGKVRSIKTDLVFHTQNRTAIDECNVGRAFRIALRSVRIQDFRFHDLRHTFATRMVQAGKDLYKVQMLLGHKTPIMTQRYAHHYPESLRDGVEVLDRIKKEFSTNLAQSNEKGVNLNG